MSNGNVRTITEGQQFELAAALVKAVPQMALMPFESAQRWIGDQRSLVSALSSVLIPAVVNGEATPTQPTMSFDWRKVYDLLGLRDKFLKFEGENPVESKDGFWNVPVIEGVTMNMVVEALKRAGSKVWLYVGNLDRDVTTNDRHPRNGSYSVRFAANVEADEDQKNLSANDLENRGVKGITLLERLLLELAYFITTGSHLDVKNVTLCSGSRYSGGSVPYVGWDTDNRRVYVGWCHPGSQHSGLRTRAAVS